MSDLIGWLVAWAAMACLLTFIGWLEVCDGLLDNRSYAMLCAVALVWPLALAVALAVLVIASIGYGLYGFYLWGRLAWLEAANYLRRKGTSE